MGGSQSTAKTKRKISLNINLPDGKETAYADEDENMYTGSSVDVQKMVNEGRKEYVNGLKTTLECINSMHKSERLHSLAANK